MDNNTLITRDPVCAPNSAIEKAALYIRSLIYSGQFAAGDQLPPAKDLCETLGVSLVTLRAAMTLLQSQGLVVVRRGKGGGSWIVDEPTLRGRWDEWLRVNEHKFGQMLVFCRMVDWEIAYLAAQNATAEDIEYLERTSASPPADDLALNKWHLQFHGALAKAAHNEYLENAMYTIRGEMFMGFPPEGDHPSLEALLALHRRVLDAVRSRDPERAVQSMKEHNNYLDQFFARAGEGSSAE